jgi:hypothetical protein
MARDMRKIVKKLAFWSVYGKVYYSFSQFRIPFRQIVSSAGLQSNAILIRDPELDGRYEISLPMGLVSRMKPHGLGGRGEGEVGLRAPRAELARRRLSVSFPARISGRPPLATRQARFLWL